MALTAESSPANDDAKQTIRRFLIRAIGVTEIDDDDDLFESGIANSLFAVQLMTFLEKTFRIEIDADDLDIKNFRSISAASDFVAKKRAAAGSAEATACTVN